MERHDACYRQYVQILREELRPATGCTEPIAIAYAAAKARSVLGALPDFFRQFPISLPLSFFLLFFFGTIIGGSQAVVALCMPIAMTAIPDEGLPFLAMLMGAVWAAMELSPTHVCAFVAADYEAGKK